MNPNALIPTPDTIPAPAWLFAVLGVVLFTLHILVINALLGTGLITLFFQVVKKTTETPDYLAENVAVKTAALFAFGINLGVAALLFLQVLYGHFMYTSSVLTAVYWILIIPLLIVAYYAGYGYIRQREKSPSFSVVSLGISTVILLYIAFAFVSNMTLLQAPERWSAYFENRGGTLTVLGDPIFWPRFFHFVVASIAIGGLFLSIASHFRARKTGADAQRHIGRGLRIFAVATTVQVLVGLWFFLVLPEKIQAAFLGENPLYTAVLGVGVTAALSMLVFAYRGKLKSSIIHLSAVVLLMAVHRFNLRAAYLAEHFTLPDLKVSPQYGVLALFLVILLLGAAAVVYMIRLVRKPTKEEAAS